MLFSCPFDSVKIRDTRQGPRLHKTGFDNYIVNDNDKVSSDPIGGWLGVIRLILSEFGDAQIFVQCPA